MLTLGIVAESRGDVRVVHLLADRLICEGCDWITPDVLDLYRRWSGLGEEPFLDVHHAFRRAQDAKLRVHGKFDGEDGHSLRAALYLFAEESPRFQAVVLMRDTDGKPERRVGAFSAIQDRNWPFEVVLASPDPEMEAWLHLAWAPHSSEETKAHQQLCQDLGFDPCREPERLQSGRSQHKKDTKSSLQRIVFGPPDELERWENIPLEQLQEKGQTCGLSGKVSTSLGTFPGFIDAFRSSVVPLFSGNR